LVGKIANICDRMLSLIIVVFTVLMVAIAGAQILCRLFFNMPLSWSEEAATYLFIWWVYMGAALAVRTASHLGIDTLTRLFSKRWARLNFVFVNLCMFAFTLLLVGYGSFLAVRTMADLTPVMRVPFGILFFIQPLSGGCMAIFVIETMIKEMRNWRRSLNSQTGT